MSRPSRRPTRRRIAVGACALGAWALGAAVASAAPPPSPTASVTSPTREASAVFTWEAVDPVTLGATVRYEGGLGAATGEIVSGVSIPLPEGPQTFRVRSVEYFGDVRVVESDFATVPIVADRSAPRITATRSPGANGFGWANRAVTVTFTCTDAFTTAVCPPAPPVGEGANQTRTSTATDGVGLTASASVTGINVDLTRPPAANLAAPADGLVTSTARPTLRWEQPPDNLSGVGGYQVFIDNPRGSGAPNFVSGAASTYTPSRDLRAGTHTWFVRSIDRALNTVDSPARTFTIDPSAPASPDAGSGPGAGSGSSSGAPSAAPRPTQRTTRSGRTVVAPPTLNWRMLKPSRGFTFRTARPRLRWKGRPAVATLYNVQIFRLRGTRLVKVHSAFPTRASYRVPRGVLRSKQTYVWRIWPFLGRNGYSKKPIGVSWFRMATPAAARR